jgi:hypothetical protein
VRANAEVLQVKTGGTLATTVLEQLTPGLRARNPVVEGAKTVAAKDGEDRSSRTLQSFRTINGLYVHLDVLTDSSNTSLKVKSLEYSRLLINQHHTQFV